ncbi:hypothetical protein [Coleofasciculus chthonoplastes]
MTRGASLQSGRTSVRPYGICDSVILINGMRSRPVERKTKNLVGHT